MASDPQERSDEPMARRNAETQWRWDICQLEDKGVRDQHLAPLQSTRSYFGLGRLQRRNYAWLDRARDNDIVLTICMRILFIRLDG
jgi:hypothetical protein